VLVRSNEANQSEFVQRAAEILRRNAIAQAQLVSDLLDLSRLQLGKFSLNRQVVSLTKTINDAVETVRAEALAKGLEVKIEMSNELVFVDGDPLRMEQIVWNLLNNAVKFTPSGGTVTVKLAKRNGFARLAVADTGQGIEPKFLPHVFEVFRQADATISRRHGGMGIGLALVQQLVQLQQGTVSVSSGGTGQGAEFTINLPLTTEATEPRKTGGLVQPNALTGMRILVVDDSADTAEMLHTLLEMDGAMVATAGSGPEALGILEREFFDVILSDISMPDMDGFELLSRLRQLPNGREVPVLALTGFGRVEDVERAQAEGFFSHITKPIDVANIVATLQKLPVRTRS
jgi:two-component system CheB/CheR fusion protein